MPNGDFSRGLVGRLERAESDEESSDYRNLRSGRIVIWPSFYLPKVTRSMVSSVGPRPSTRTASATFTRIPITPRLGSSYTTQISLTARACGAFWRKCNPTRFITWLPSLTLRFRSSSPSTPRT